MVRLVARWMQRLSRAAAAAAALCCAANRARCDFSGGGGGWVDCMWFDSAL